MFEGLFSRFKRDTIIKESNEDLSLDEENVINEIKDFMASKKRQWMITGEKYYDGKHDILKRKRTVIGQDGKLEEIDNLPNNRIVDNQYQKMVDQKNNYLLGQPFSIQTNNDTYAKLLKDIFNKKFRKLLKNIGEDSLNEGIGWMFIYYDEHGKFTFKRFKPYEIIPIWKDTEHTELDYAIRLYTTIKVEKKKKKYIDHIEVYNQDGIYHFIYEGGKLIPDSKKPFENYFTIVDVKGNIQGYNWTKIPLIPFKYNSKEIPLIKKLKSLQDGLNLIESNFLNQMEEDVRNTILVLVNYDGQNLAQFRKNLAQYGAVKVKTVDGAAGDLKTLQIEVNSENYKVILDIFKKAIIENARGYDAKDDRLGNNPNQMNIQSIFSDIDLDANGTETEYQAAFEEVLWFVNCHLANTSQGNFENEDVEIIFNRDMLISESEIIDNINNSQDLSLESRLANHPWVDDVNAELERIKKEKEEEVSMYPFPSQIDPSKTKPNDEGGDVEDGEENSEYWQGRFEQLEKASHKDALTTYSHIEQSFIDVQRDIERQINNWYVRFANNNEISISEAKKWLTGKDLKEFKWDVQEYIKYGQENEMNELWMKELENASAKYHISRLEALKLQTQQSLEKLFGNELDEVDKMTSNAYTNNYYHTMFEMQKGFNVGFNIGTIDENKLSKIVSKPWAVDEKNFSERIWNNKTKMINELHNQLTIMCVQGKSPDNVIKYMSKKFNTSKAQAGNLVMTESAYFSSLAQKDCFKDLDVEEYEIVTTLDSHTSSICQEQDGKVYKMNDYQPGVTAPPFHNRCRSTTVPHFNDDYDIKDTRAARDEDGKTYYVEGDVKYKDWYNKHVQDISPKESKLKNQVKDAKIKVNQSGKWKDFATMDEVKEYVYNKYKDSDIDKIRNVESINTTFKQLDELQNQYPLNNEIFVRNKTMSSAAAQGNYQGISINTAHFNKANRTALVGDNWVKDCDKQIEDLKQYLGNMKYKQKPIEKGIKRLEEQKKYNCFSISGSYSDLESIKATISHEYGHVVADQYFGQVNQSRANKNFDFFDSNECWQKCNYVADTYYKAIKNNDIYNISYYASTDRYEFFAECFAKKQMGGTLPDYINEMLERVLKNGK